MRYTPLTGYEQMDKPYEAHFEDLSLNTGFTSCLDESWTLKGTARRWKNSTGAHKTYKVA
jgi:hypothetical protein